MPYKSKPGYERINQLHKLLLSRARKNSAQNGPPNWSPPAIVLLDLTPNLHLAPRNCKKPKQRDARIPAQNLARPGAADKTTRTVCRWQSSRPHLAAALRPPVVSTCYEAKPPPFLFSSNKVTRSVPRGQVSDKHKRRRRRRFK